VAKVDLIQKANEIKVYLS